jgi:hypothetical protein
MFYIFLNQKTSTLTLQMYCGLHFQLLPVHDCFKHAAGQDIFLLDWRQVLSYDVSFLNIRLVVNSVINLVISTKDNVTFYLPRPLHFLTNQIGC